MQNIILIGYGYWGKILATQLYKSKNINFIGIIEKDNSNKRDFKIKFPKKKVFESINELKKKNINIDAAIVATNLKSLYRITFQLLKRGIHCLVEKPVSQSLKEINNLYQLSKSKNLVCMPGYIFIHNESIKFIRRIIKKNLLGDIRIVTLERTNLGPIRNDCGSNWDLASHDISILHYLFKKNIFIENSFSKAFLKKKINDYCLINFSISKKIFGFIHCSWLNPKKERKMTIVGSKKMLVWDDMNIDYPITIYDKSVRKKKTFIDNFEKYKNYLHSGKIFKPKIKKTTPLENEIKYFLNSIKSKQKYSNMKIAYQVSKVLRKIN